MKRLEKLFKESKKISIDSKDKFIIFSDLHIGNGGFNDDFNPNSQLLIHILNNHYFSKGYKLILNGDVEELYKFSYKDIYNRWSEFYQMLDKYNSENRLFKIVGNHDYELKLNPHLQTQYELLDSLILEYKKKNIFIFHGHQTSSKIEQYSKLALFLVKYIFRTVSNKSVPIDNNKKYLTEEISYKFSSHNRLISILGHTHRPLFESLSKIDSLKLTIENLCRQYSISDDSKQKKIRNFISEYKHELEGILEKGDSNTYRDSIYNNKILIPCLFNSGAVTGKRGITGIEIKKGKISLVYWFDVFRSRRYLNYQDVAAKKLKGTNFYKASLKTDSLDYVFSRIDLLS